MTEGLVAIGAVDFAEAQRLKLRLAERGVHVEVAVRPDACGSGRCAPKAELWAQPDDLKLIQRILGEKLQLHLAEMGVDATLLDKVFDPTAAEATCPACGTAFVPSLGECPDCGLSFATP